MTDAQPAPEDTVHVQITLFKWAALRRAANARKLKWMEGQLCLFQPERPILTGIDAEVCAVRQQRF